MMDMRENCAKTAELIDVLFGGRTHGTLYKIQIPGGKGTPEGDMRCNM